MVFMFKGQEELRKNKGTRVNFYRWVSDNFIKKQRESSSSQAAIAAPSNPDRAQPLGIIALHLKEFLNGPRPMPERIAIGNTSPTTPDLPFCLGTDRFIRAPPTMDEVSAIMHLVPGTWSVKCLSPYLIIVTDQLSASGDLPGSIAGVACYYTDRNDDLGPLGGAWCFGAPMFPEDALSPWDPRASSKMGKYLTALKSWNVHCLAWAGTRWIMFYDDIEREEARSLPFTLGMVIAVAVPWSVTQGPGFRRLVTIMTSDDYKGV